MSRSYAFATSTLLLLLGLSQPLTAQVAPTMFLPPGALNQSSTPTNVTVTLSSSYSSTYVQFFASFSGVPSGYSISSGTYLGWCADPFADFVANPPYTLISTYDTVTLANPPGGGIAQSPNWNAINWVLNNKPTTGALPTWIVQQVIWKLLTGQYISAVPGGYYDAPAPSLFPFSASDTTTANALYTAALANSSFVPGPGQVAGVLLYVDGINPDGSSPSSNYVVSNNNINPLAPPLSVLNGQPNLIQEILIEVPVGPGSIGDYVWQDTNENGIQDPGEPGINGVTVQLCQDQACNTVLATTTTTSFQGLNGYYQFTGLPLGTYYVSINKSQPALSGLVPTQTGAGTAGTDSDVNPTPIILSTGSPVNETIDFGFTPPGTGAIGKFVWNDSNGNGLQDPGEPGIPGVKVNLCQDALCTQVIATTTTDANGHYSFTGLVAGTYYVAVVASTLPPGFVPTLIQVGFPADSSIDSNANPAQVILADNFTNNTINFGFIPPAQGSIGYFVWHDLNRNGIQDSGEPGINNVTLRLYNSSNVLIATTTTTTANGSDGYYQFTGLAAGTYTVVVDPTTLPPSYSPTTSNAPGSTPANGSVGSPATFTLATNSSTNENVNFGYVTPCMGVIGDFVWNDLNDDGIQQINEPGIAGVTLYLRASDNSLITSTMTDANGAYHFTGVCAGTYTVQVTPPAGFVASPSNTGTPANDSSGSPATVVLGQDATNDNVDFGYYYQPPALTCSSVTAGEVGVAFSSPALTVASGTAPYTFSVATGAIPAGLTLNSTTGVITGTPTAAGTFTLKATDAKGSVAATTCAYTIVAGPSVTCSAVTSGEVGVAFSSPALTVASGTAPYTFSVATGAIPAGLTLSSTTGAITGTPTAAGTFTLKATDAKGSVAATTCAYTIVAGPSVTCSAVTSGEVGVAFSSPALTVASGTAPYTFSVATGAIPAGLTLNSTTGAISGTPTAAGTFTLKATDAKGSVAATTCAYTIVAAPSLTCSAVNSGEVGVAFSSPALTVASGTAPYTFSVATGAIPAGLTLNSTTGAISGTPTAAGTFTLKATDAKGSVAATTCAYTIVAAPSVTCSAVTSGEIGVAFSSPALTVASGTAPYTFSVATGAIPAGLTLNSTTGAITGTPTAAGTFTLKATDAKGSVAAITCAYTIVAGPSVTCSAVNSGEVGVAFSSPALTVASGTAPYTFSVATGALPAGLTLNSTTGAITGTPTAAGTFTIKVTDAKGVVTATTCAYTIVAKVALTCGTCAGVPGEGLWLIPYSKTVAATGGSGSYKYSIISGALPAGLTLNSTTGAITGTPTWIGISTFTTQVTDSLGGVATAQCSLIIL